MQFDRLVPQMRRLALAAGARAALGASVGVGITGVAGPGGGTPDKPVGMVCLSVAHADGRRLDHLMQSLGTIVWAHEMGDAAFEEQGRAMLRRTVDGLPPA